MSKTIDYYLTLTSLWTYYGSARIEEMARAHGAKIRAKRTNYRIVFPRTGGLPLPTRAPERQAYRPMELKRWRAYMDMTPNPHSKFFPVPATACMVNVVERSASDPLRLAHAILYAVGSQDRQDFVDRELAA